MFICYKGYLKADLFRMPAANPCFSCVTRAIGKLIFKDACSESLIFACYKGYWKADFLRMPAAIPCFSCVTRAIGKLTF